MYYVYVLINLKNNRLYTGSTDDIVRRIKEHNTGKSRYTRATRPFKLLYTETFKTLSEARRREMFLKTGKGRKLLKQVLSNMRP